MTPERLRSLLTHRAGSGADPVAVATAARDTYDDLQGVLIPLIGEAGVDALTGRAVHVAQRTSQYEWGGQTEQAHGPFSPVTAWMERQTPVLATEGAASVLSEMVRLLLTFLGESLTNRLLRKAWPDSLPGVSLEETST